MAMPSSSWVIVSHVIAVLVLVVIDWVAEFVRTVRGRCKRIVI
jgi:hypothetical protein